MSPSEKASIISQTTFIAASISIFALSLLVAFGRTAIRLRYQKRLFHDDIFLLAAVLCLSGSMALLLRFATLFYLVGSRTTSNTFTSSESPPGSGGGSDKAKLAQETHSYHTVASVYHTLSWTTIFVVKGGFLAFFRTLLKRVNALMIYWQVVTVATVLVWVYGGTSAILFCFGNNYEGGKFHKGFDFGASMIALDIVTDIFIILIPIYLIRQVQIRLRQKLILAISLSLSFMMIITAVIRISSVRQGPRDVNITWWIFWLFIEACVSVIMVSMTAFRSLFMAHQAQLKQNRLRILSWKKPRARNLARTAESLEAGGDNETRGFPQMATPLRMSAILEFPRIQGGTETPESEESQDRTLRFLQDRGETSTTSEMF